mmetsp:Transcript_9582/g.39383  ORF Transcript_9582/g.39383 Transcript_9582/m.39383 type:complete len:247 (-) Transcript_9582:609-1349(-)
MAESLKSGLCSLRLPPSVNSCSARAHLPARIAAGSETAPRSAKAYADTSRGGGGTPSAVSSSPKRCHTMSSKHARAAAASSPSSASVKLSNASYIRTGYRLRRSPGITKEAQQEPRGGGVRRMTPWAFSMSSHLFVLALKAASPACWCFGELASARSSSMSSSQSFSCPSLGRSCLSTFDGLSIRACIRAPASVSLVVPCPPRALSPCQENGSLAWPSGESVSVSILSSTAALCAPGALCACATSR